MCYLYFIILKITVLSNVNEYRNLSLTYLTILRVPGIYCHTTYKYMYIPEEASENIRYYRYVTATIQILRSIILLRIFSIVHTSTSISHTEGILNIWYKLPRFSSYRIKYLVPRNMKRKKKRKRYDISTTGSCRPCNNPRLSRCRMPYWNEIMREKGRIPYTEYKRQPRIITEVITSTI